MTANQPLHALVVMSTSSPSRIRLAAMQFSDITWLDPERAFEILGEKEELEAAARNLVGQDVDFAVVPCKNRRKRLLISDMDSTLIEQECIDEIADTLGLKDKVSAITERAMAGEIEFDDALRERVAMLKGIPTSKLESIWNTKIHLMPGAKEAVATMRSFGAYCILVSGGFTFFSSRVRDVLGFHEDQSNVLLSENDVLTGEVGAPILGQDAKRDALDRCLSLQGLELGDALAVGDGANDLKMICVAGMGVAFQAKPKVQEQAQYRLNHTDLRGLLYLQGYEAYEFKSEV